MMKQISILFSLLFFFSLQSQQNFRFIQYLTQENKHREAIYLLNAHELSDPDTTNYLLGMNYYLLRKPDSASFYFHQVPHGSAFFLPSAYYSDLNLAYTKDFSAALELARKLPSDTARGINQLRIMFVAGTELLSRHPDIYDSISKKFLYNDHLYSAEQNKLDGLANELKHMKRKSPVVAGLLSAAIPGAGKFYSGKRGAGMAAFITNLAFAGMAYEAYYRTGSVKSPQFIVFGSIFAFFYTGNIMGSVFSVRHQIRTDNNRINNEILATLHIPLVRIFKP